jgi:Ca2+-binding EF-hand superfamily protein
MGLALASWLTLDAADAVAAPLGNTKMLPDGFDLLQPNEPTVADAAAARLGFMDADGDGTVTLQELQQNLPSIRSVPDQEYVQYLHRLYDIDVDGKLSKDEFLTSTALEACVAEDEVSTALFQVFDKNNNQLVDSQEFRAAWGSKLGSRDDRVARRVFRKTDMTGDGNGSLDEVEFVKAMNMLRMLFTD